MINIVVPMAGRGSRFATVGYQVPKPLISVRGRPMIEVVIENLKPSTAHRFVFICQQEHLDRFGLQNILHAAGPQTEIVRLSGITEGAACTVLTAERFIDVDQPLMIANCDQYVTTPIDAYLGAMQRGGFDGFIMTMTASDPKWSFVRLNARDEVSEVVEKRVVSSEATVGIYNYQRGGDFIAAATEMIKANDRTNDEFYVAPTYNYMVRRNRRVGYLNIGAERAGMYGLGVPEDVEYFNSLPHLPEHAVLHGHTDVQST